MKQITENFTIKFDNLIIAEKKLDADIEKMTTFIQGRECGFISLLELGNDMMVFFGDKKDTLRSALWGPNSIIFKAVKDKWLPIYIENESREFMEKVDSLKNEVDALLSGDYRQEEYWRFIKVPVIKPSELDWDEGFFIAL